MLLGLPSHERAEVIEHARRRGRLACTMGGPDCLAQQADWLTALGRTGIRQPRLPWLGSRRRRSPSSRAPGKKASEGL